MKPFPEVFPQRDVAELIVLEVLRPQIETYRDQGLSVTAQTVFVAHGEHRLGPTLGSIGKAVRTTIYIHCHPWFGDVLQVRCSSRVAEASDGQNDPIEWDLETQIRRDERGLYFNQVSMHPKTKLRDA